MPFAVPISGNSTYSVLLSCQERKRTEYVGLPELKI
jgi:hypothetical protein